MESISEGRMRNYHPMTFEQNSRTAVLGELGAATAKIYEKAGE